MRNYTLAFAVIGLSFIAAGCAQSTPSKKFTAADVAKLKWIEGTWRGMDGDKPFYERYKVEVGSSRVDLQACKLEYSIVSPK